jgi:hypothetical protein
MQQCHDAKVGGFLIGVDDLNIAPPTGDLLSAQMMASMLPNEANGDPVAHGRG